MGGQNCNLEQEFLKCLKSIKSHKEQHSTKSKNIGNDNKNLNHNGDVKSSFKRNTSQKNGGTKKLKLRDSSRLNGKRCGLNVHTILSNMGHVPVSVKQSDKSLDSGACSFIPQYQKAQQPLYSNIQSVLRHSKIKAKENDTEQIRSLLYLLESARTRALK